MDAQGNHFLVVLVLVAQAEAFRHEVRTFLEAHPASEEIRNNRHNFSGHDPEFHRAMARAGLLYASWPEEYGGQERDPFEVAALYQEMAEAGHTIYTVGTTRMVAETIMAFGQEELKRDVLPKIAAGEALCSLGYTEPASGSDVAAAQTRAVRNGNDWICLLYTSPSPRDATLSRMPSSA